MAARFDAQSKGWQTYAKPIGRLESYGTKFVHCREERVKALPEDDECIYYPTVYGKEDKLKIVSNQGYGLYGKSEFKTKDTRLKPTKTDSYESTDEGIYEVLRCKVTQPSSQPFRVQLGNRNPHTPVPKNVLRALNNDFVQNRGRVLTFEPNSCRRQSPEFAKNNNYESTGKYMGHNGFVSPQFEHSLIEQEDSDELLDYCTCMCIVKGAFYHFTKDSEDEGHLADQPCSCAGPLSQCLPRWGCLGIFTVFLPCLWCYLPMKGCKQLSSAHKCSHAKTPLHKPGK